MIEVLRDHGPGEWRVAMAEQGKIVEIHLRRIGELLPGETGMARLRSKSRAGNFLITHDGQDILVRSAIAEPEGAMIPYCITRSAIAEPGQIKCAQARLAEASAAPVCADATWDAHVAGLAGNAGADSVQAPSRPYDLGPLLDQAALGLVQGGDALVDFSISFERTKAGLIFDIDGTSRKGHGAHAINLAAADLIPRLLRLYHVAGSVVIDYIASASKSERLAIGAAFDAASKADPRPYERSAVNGFGLMHVVRAKTRPSVLDHLFGTNTNSISDETQALWLLRDAARSSGVGLRTITASPAVAKFLGAPHYAILLDQLSQNLGAAVTVVADDSITDYGHVHVAQR
jgi:ribonuclease G